jgi:hypothetical protein
MTENTTTIDETDNLPSIETLELALQDAQDEAGNLTRAIEALQADKSKAIAEAARHGGFASLRKGRGSVARVEDNIAKHEARLQELRHEEIPALTQEIHARRNSDRERERDEMAQQGRELQAALEEGTRKAVEGYTAWLSLWQREVGSRLAELDALRRMAGREFAKNDARLHAFRNPFGESFPQGIQGFERQVFSIACDPERRGFKSTGTVTTRVIEYSQPGVDGTVHETGSRTVETPKGGPIPGYSPALVALVPDLRGRGFVGDAENAVQVQWRTREAE